MRLSLAITRINYALRGSDDDAPVVGSDEYTYWLDTLNRKKNELYQDVSKQWSYAHETRELGTISAGEDIEIDLDDDFLGASARVYVKTLTGEKKYFKVVKAFEINDYRQEVYIEGRDPQTLKFTKEILADDSIVGGTLYVPGYYMPDDVKNANEEIPFPDAEWGVMATASFIAFNDIVYETKSEDLNAMANSLYDLMVKANYRGTSGEPRTIRRNMRRISSPGMG